MLITEIPARQLEREICAGAPIGVLDVRTPADFDAWQIECGSVPLVNRYVADVVADPAGAASGLPRPVRVICTRGRSSLDAAEALVAAGIDAVSVAGGMIGWSRLLTASEVPLRTATRVIQFRREARGCLSYLVASETEALVVDPAPAIQAYLDTAEQLGVRITHVFDTHVHADHLSGMRDLAAATDGQMHVSHRALGRGIRYGAIAPLGNGDRIAVGSARIEVLALPGHTTDMAGVLVDGVALIAGDSVFADSVARPDLEVGDAGAAAAGEVLHATLHERILTLGDDVVLLPCHYPGGRLDGAIAPTIGEVRRNVAVLAIADPSEFARTVIAAMPPRPLNYENIIAVNLGADGGDVAGLEVGANNCAAKA